MNRINNLHVRVDGSRWLVKEAHSLEDAMAAIANARVTGSVGHTTTIEDNGKHTVLASVSRLTHP